MWEKPGDSLRSEVLPTKQHKVMVKLCLLPVPFCQVLQPSLICPSKPTPPPVCRSTGSHQRESSRVTRSSCLKVTTRCRRDDETSPALSSARSRVSDLELCTGWWWWPIVGSRATRLLSGPGQVRPWGKLRSQGGEEHDVIVMSSVDAVELTEWTKSALWELKSIQQIHSQF